MLAKTFSYSLCGLHGFKVEIEVDINSGMPCCEVVGLPDTAVKESKERVRSAIKNSGLGYPVKRIVINLAPAERRKEGSLFDLAIAIGMLSASEQITNNEYKKYCFIGELSLGGQVRHVSGLLPILIAGIEDKETKFIIPKENEKEASYIRGVEVYAVESLRQTVDFINGEIVIEPIKHSEYDNVISDEFKLDIADVKGQVMAKRAIEIAVSGGHNALMIGPPGAGKSMLAKCIPSIMPVMTFEEALQVTKIHSIAATLDKSKGIMQVRPFRAPHHTATIPSLTGGSSSSKPGEISLAHNGVLFLDEMPEYSRRTLESLRQPLEDGKVVVARATQTVEYPANFMLIASMNPCPCGNYGSDMNNCKCTSGEIRRYVSKLSGPMLDRIDIHIEMDNIKYDELRGKKVEENSETVRDRVEKARAIQNKRFESDGIFTNAEMTSAMVNKYCKIDEIAETMLKTAFKKLGLSARATTRILKVSRTIADLDESQNVEVKHIAEAIQYRSLDRKYWS